MNAALEWRRRAFLFVGFPCLLLVAFADAIAGLFGKGSDPDALTAGLWALMVVDSALLSRFLFRRSQVLKLGGPTGEAPASIGALGKTVSFLAASLAAVPILMGFVLLTISGDAWRLYAFAPISALTALYLWRRIETVLREIEQTGSGVAGAAPVSDDAGRRRT